MTVKADSDLSARVDRLTPRQVQCLRLVYERRTSKEIAADLGLSSATVDGYITEAVATLGARNRRHAAELLDRALPHGNRVPQSPRDESNAQTDQAGEPVQVSRTDWLPLRQRGAFGNDVHPTIRILCIPILAVVLATGFGMFANGARVVSDFFAAWFG